MKSLHQGFSLIQQEEEPSQSHLSKNEEGRKKKREGKANMKGFRLFSLYIAP